MAAVVVMVYGSYLATTMPIDVFPDLDRPRVVLLTESPGMSPEEVESLVAQPIETAILGAPGVEAVRSQSSQGQSSLTSNSAGRRRSDTRGRSFKSD